MKHQILRKRPVLVLVLDILIFLCARTADPLKLLDLPQKSESQSEVSGQASPEKQQETPSDNTVSSREDASDKAIEPAKPAN